MIEPRNSVLVVVDVQEGLVPAMHNREHVLKRITTLISGARVLGMPVIVTEQAPEKLGTTVSQIAEISGDGECIPKTTFSCCGSDAFLARLGGFRPSSVLMAGMETHVCIHQTAQELLESGHAVYVAGDAVTSRCPEDHQLALARLRQIGVAVSSVEMLLTELVRDTRNPCFKDILALIR